MNLLIRNAPARNNELKPTVFWFTGLSGSGKTAVASELVRILRQKGLKAEHLDGDEIRKQFPMTGFAEEERNAHIRRVSTMAHALKQKGIFPVVSLISPYQETRRFARDLCEDFVEIYLSTPLSECERRDPKGLYEKAKQGVIKNFTGLDDRYDIPLSPEVTLDTTNWIPEQAAKYILFTLRILNED